MSLYVLVRVFVSILFFDFFFFFFWCLFSDRVCQQPGLSLWVPFQNAATAVTNLYKGKDNLGALPVKGRGRQGVCPVFDRVFCSQVQPLTLTYFAI